MKKPTPMTSGLIAAFIGMAWLVSAGAVQAQDVIKIAAGAPLTGPLAKQGQEVANAVKLAVEEWNAKGGVLGKQIEVLEADDQGNPQVGVAAAEKVAADPAVVGAIWGITSVTCIPVSEIFEQESLVMISPGCTNPQVTDRGLKSVNRLCARDDLQGPAGMVFAVDELQAKKIAMFDDGTTGPRGVADEAEKKGKELGVEVERYVIRSGDKDFRAILGTLPKDIDLIYASLWAPDAALLVKQLPDVGLETPVIGPDGQYEPVDYIEASAGAAEGNYVSFLVPDLKKVPTATAFAEAFEAEYGPLSSYGPLAYEATNLMLSAIEQAGELDRAAIRDAVRATENYTGILGFPITFDDKGDVVGANVYIYQVQGTGFELVSSVSLK
jgi:branched-chain amino acid transport system substrate-binding protein